MKRLSILLLCGLALPAFASDEYRIDIDTAAVHRSYEEPKPEPNWSSRLFEGAEIEGGLSSWAPHNLVLPSQISGASAFTTSGLPHLDLSVATAPVLSGSAGALRVRGGIGFSSLQRSGTLAGSSVISDQDLILLPLEAGLEFQPAFLSWKNASAYFAESALPTLALTQRSIFDPGTTTFGVASQTLVGLNTDLGGIFRPFPASLDVNFSLTAGSIGGGNLYGLGVGAGVRVGI